MDKVLNYLLENNLITNAELIDVEDQSNRTGEGTEEIILNRRIIQDSLLLEIKEKIYGIPSVNLFGVKIKQEFLNIITEDLAKNYKIVVFNVDGNNVSVAISDPTNYKAKEALEFAIRSYKYTVKYFVSTLPSIEYALKQYSDLKTEVAKEIDDVDIKIEENFIQDSLNLNSENGLNSPVSKMVSAIIKHAIDENVSDIHIEPTREDVRVRYRVDGELYTSTRLPKYMHESIVTRIKVMASLKIDENRIPQDGRIRLNVNNHFYDFRISIIPISDGEKIVMRILDTSKEAPTLESLGVSGRNLKLLNEEIKSKAGIILVCGPTGSGKSTTLFSLLSMLNKENVNIVTLEDPVEYIIPGVNHSQVRAEIGYTFANGIRSFLRQDPDVIMVGEVRDNETAELCVHAGLTGHLVLTTLHTNSAIGAIPRLFDMKVEPFLLSSSLNLIFSQRLVRRICEHCKSELILDRNVISNIKTKMENINPKVLEENNIDLNNLKFYKGKGCSYCQNTGYKGRIAVVETIKVTDDIKSLIERNEVSEKIEEEIKKQNFVSIFEDGLIKSANGLITLEDCLNNIDE